MSITKDALMDTGPNTPVRTEVRKHLPDIAAALDEGASQGAIYRTLKRQGFEVGKNVSSFRVALKALKTEIASLRVSQPPVDDPEVTQEQASERSNFADDRHETTWGS